jgi:hypothetical protein
VTQLKPRVISVGEFTAESLETQAAELPPSEKKQASILREAAKLQREHGSKKKIRVWEKSEQEPPM